MKAENQSLLDWIGERMIVAFVTTVLAAITLFLYPIVLSFLVVSHGGNGQGIGIFPLYYQILFSRTGLFLMAGAGCAGFLIGPHRMASVFSFFWGTHPFWRRLEEKLNDWRDEHCSAGWMLAFLLVILAIVLWVQFG